MTGSHHVMVCDHRVQYDFVLQQKVTVIQGDSATGKTTLIGMIQTYEEIGPLGPIQLHCDVPCTVISGVRWQTMLRGIHESIVFIDAPNRFMITAAFAQEVQRSDNYFVCMTREALPLILFDDQARYGIWVTQAPRDTKKIYHELYRMGESALLDVLSFSQHPMKADEMH